MGKGPAPVYVVMAGAKHEPADVFAVIMGKDAKAWAERLVEKIKACETDEAVQKLAAHWEANDFISKHWNITRSCVANVSVREVTPCRCYMTVADADREVD